jgi:hypothetical protein
VISSNTSQMKDSKIESQPSTAKEQQKVKFSKEEAPK